MASRCKMNTVIACGLIVFMAILMVGIETLLDGEEE